MCYRLTKLNFIINKPNETKEISTEQGFIAEHPVIDLYNTGKLALREKKERIRTERNQAGAEPEGSSLLATTHSAGGCYEGCLAKNSLQLHPSKERTILNYLVT